MTLFKISAKSPLPSREGAGGGACRRAETSPQSDTPHPNPSPKGEGIT